MSSGTNETIGIVASRPISDSPHPFSNTATSTP